MKRYLMCSSAVATLIFFLVVSKLTFVGSKACQSFFPCQVDADCWNGPGFRCVDAVDKKGDQLFQPLRICVCGGPTNISEPDGIPRQFFCSKSKSGYKSNTLRCLIQPGWPCWPTHDAIALIISKQGYLRREEERLRRSFLSRRDYLCGSGQCLEILDATGSDICRIINK